MDKKIAFIVNPVSGGRASKKILREVAQFAEVNTYSIHYTEQKGHAQQLAQELKNNHEILVVVGGDGTINEVAGVVANNSIPMGIIPAGSGNGLAHQLGIPIKTSEALAILNRSAKSCDAIEVNNQIIVNVGGLGFDGHVAKLFNEGTNRGNISYAKLIIKELLRFKEQDYSLNISNTITEGKAFMIAFANGSEFGNRFIINPGANHDNGKLNLVVVRKPPLYKLPALLYAGFKGTLGESKYYKRYLIEEFELSCPGASLHRDGEVDSYDSNSPLTIRIIPKALDIIY